MVSAPGGGGAYRFAACEQVWQVGQIGQVWQTRQNHCVLGPSVSGVIWSVSAGPVYLRGQGVPRVTFDPEGRGQPIHPHQHQEQRHLNI